MGARLRLFVVALSFAGTSLLGCTCHSTGANEVGVLTRKVTLLGTRGVQPEVYPPGSTYFFPAFVTDWHTYQTQLQNLTMSDRNEQRPDGMEFKTVDGNDVAVDVTVAWRIDPTKAPHLLSRVAPSTQEVQERLVRPATRALVRDALNRLHSEDFYVAEKRFAAAEAGRKLLSAALAEEGIIVEQVILQEHRFHQEYEAVIRDKKLAEQTAEKLRSEALAGAEAAKSNLESAKGKVSQQLAAARGALEQARLRADASLIQARNEADALLAEARAKAKGIEKQNEAMAGAGGRTMVKLRIAEALQSKRVVFLPTGGKGGGGTLQTLDLNPLILPYAAAQAVQATRAKKATGTEAASAPTGGGPAAAPAE